MFRRICGIDEAGRGALAGPLVAAAVLLPSKTIKTVSRRAGTKTRDSKLLSPLWRRKIYTILKRMKAEIIVEMVSPRSINNHGIGWANKEIMRRLIKRMNADKYILDGNLNIGRIKGKTNKIISLIDADATVPSVILAGIVAKVERDKFMLNLHQQYPHFHWNQNKGYGTKRHIEAIMATKVTRYHRNVFVSTAIRNYFPKTKMQKVINPTY